MFHKKMKTALILSLALTSFGAFSAPSFAAGYTLNPEVKDFYAFTVEDLLVENYQAGPQVKNIPIAV